MSLTTINPANEDLLHEYAVQSPDEVESILKNVQAAQKEWAARDFNRRSDCFRLAATMLRENKKRYAELMAREMGKPLIQGGGEVDKCAWACEYYADHAEEMLRAQSVEVGARKSYVCFEPLGVVLAIMPWNFPFWQVFRFAAPTLMAGNAGLLKHSPNTTGCALAIEEIFQKSGFPKNLFCTLVIDLEQTGRVIDHTAVSAVTLTGSTRAGKAVAARAGAGLKKCVLELGGSDPYIVLGDADLEEAANICISSRMNNAGQTCIAAKRIIVIESVFAKFQDIISQKMKQFVAGDPLDMKTTLGPMARADLREGLHRQVQESIQKGARCVLGGSLPGGKGFYYPATVLTGVGKGMPAFDEELFGPVACLISARDEAEALALANETPYGLGACVLTRDVVRGEKLARQINAGNCFVNSAVKSDPRLPFGGIKHSGFGRELGDFGIREFCNVKTVFVA